MPIELRAYAPRDFAALHALLRDPSLAGEFDTLQSAQAVEGWLADPFLDRELHCLAWEGEKLAAFAAPYVLPGREGRFAVIRCGVLGTHRRRGIGTLLYERQRSAIAERHPDVHEVSVSAWLPAAGAEGFAAARGFDRVRTYWLMERPRGPIAGPAWPQGMRLAGDQDPERSWRDLTAAYNDSFANHYHSSIVTIEDTRSIFTRPGFRRDGYVLAYRDQTCVGFCRCELHQGRGEIALVGTVEAARGIGLGRALLRWGVRWLEREGVARVTLLVDGDNENALRLYRSEGFDVVQTRAAWNCPNSARGDTANGAGGR